MQNEVSVTLMWILIKMIDAVGVEEGTAPLNSMNLISFMEEKFG